MGIVWCFSVFRDYFTISKIVIFTTFLLLHYKLCTRTIINKKMKNEVVLSKLNRTKINVLQNNKTVLIII